MPYGKRSLTAEQIEALDTFEQAQYRAKRQSGDMIEALETIARLRIDLARTSIRLREASDLVSLAIKSNCPPEIEPAEPTPLPFAAPSEVAF